MEGCSISENRLQLWVDSMDKPIKPLGKKAYGSIGHLPSSRLGPGDHKVTEGQARICTIKARDKYDNIYVQEKLDGSCTCVCKLNGQILALSRSGYLASSSPYEQHHMFADWVHDNWARFYHVLREGERLCGEWIAQAHGTRYDLKKDKIDPWIPFDLFVGDKRVILAEFLDRLYSYFSQFPTLYLSAIPVMPEVALHWFQRMNIFNALDPLEGVVYRVERKGEVDFLAKYVVSTKVDGCYLPEVSGKEAIWNWP